MLLLLTGFFAISLVSCEDDGTESLSADEARAELQAAGDEIMTHMGLMMATPPMESLSFFMMLMDMDFDFDMREAAARSVESPHELTMPGIGRLPALGRGLAAQKGQPDETIFYGVFRYNFNTGEFDQINQTEVDYLEFQFPASESAYDTRLINGILRIDNLLLAEVVIDDGFGVDTDVVPVRADVRLDVDNQTLMSLSYQLSLNPEGLPTAGSMTLDMPPYVMEMNFSGSGRNFNTTLDFRADGTPLMVSDLDIRYTAGLDDVERVSGYFQLSPLRFSGNILPLAQEECHYTDLDCMNNNMDIELLQAAKNKRIGKVEYRLYEDPHWGEAYPELAIVYADGSYDFFFEAFHLDEGFLK